MAADLDLGGIQSPSAGEPLPAVSSLNGKLSLSGGGTQPGYDVSGFFPFDDDFEGGFKAKGSVTVPIAYRYGFQADGVLGTVQDEFYGHGGAHLFWRDPSFGLLGTYGGRLSGMM